MTKKESFVITRVSRPDLIDAGFTEEQIAKIPDSEMEHLASKMANAYVENTFWIDLEILANDLLAEYKK
jgi:hypothetical protein